MLENYSKAKKLGLSAVRKAVSEGKYPYIPNLEDYLKSQKTLGEVYVGEMEIPISMVSGTRNSDRKDAFARNFMPVLDESSEFATKWMGVYNHQISEGISDPVIAYEYMHRFYIREGNKRVSVLSYIGADRVPAKVTRILPEKTNDEDIQCYYEFLDFFRVTGLYDIKFSTLGSYKKLANKMGLTLEEKWGKDSISSLKSAHYIFESVYKKKSRNLPVSDAFLVFLDYFELDWIFENSRDELEKHLDQLKREFISKRGQEEVNFQDTYDDNQKTSIIDMVLPTHTKSKPLKAAFLYEASPDVSSWVYAHEIGRKEAEDSFEGLIETFIYEKCDSKETVTLAVEDAIRKGSEVIFAISPIQLQHILQLSLIYPEVKFLNCSVNITRNSVRSYYGRMYEAKYLMGILAGILSTNNKVGYVGDYPIFGSFAKINAFATGVATTAPGAKVYLVWAGEKESKREEVFRNNDIRIFSGPENIKHNVYDKDWGLISIEDGEYKNIALPICDWGLYYENIIRSIINKTWNAKALVNSTKPINYWWGMDTGVIDLEVSNRLPAECVTFINSVKKAMKLRVINPFEGLTYEDIIAMEDLNPNVIGHIPSYEELTERGKRLRESNGYIPGDEQ